MTLGNNELANIYAKGTGSGKESVNGKELHFPHTNYYM